MNNEYGPRYETPGTPPPSGDAICPPLEVPWNKRDLVVSMFLGIVVLGLLVLMLGLALRVFQEITGQENPDLFTIVIFVSELGLLVPVWLLGIRKYRVPWACAGFRRFSLRRGLGLGCLFLFGSLLFNYVYAFLLDRFTGQSVQPEMLSQFGGGLRGLLLALVAGAIIAPLAEESFFRGFIYAGLRRYTGHADAVLISAAIFAVVHILPTSYPPIFVLGVLFAVLYEQTGSIWPAVILHGIINALGFIGTYLVTSMP